MRFIVAHIIFFLFTLELFSQVQQNANYEQIRIINSDRLIKSRLEKMEIDSLVGNVMLLKDSSYMFCDKAVLYNKNELNATGNVSILQNDTIKVFCDSLWFHSDSTLALLFGNVILENGSESLKTDFLEYDMKAKIANFSKGAILKKKSTSLKSYRGKYFMKLKEARFANSVQLVDSSFTLRTDSIIYHSRMDKLDFYGPSIITRDSSTIYCERGIYWLNEENALFEINTQYLKGNSKAVAEKIIYHGKQAEIILEGNAVYEEDDVYAEANRILFNEESENSTLAGNAFFKDLERKIYADVIYYNAESGHLLTKGRTTMLEDSISIEADKIEYFKEEGAGFAEGQVIWKDSSSNLTIQCERFTYTEEPESTTATGTQYRPLLESYLEEDTLFLSADEFRTEITVDSLDSTRLFFAVRQVKLFKKNFAAICDSLIYDIADSIYFLYGQPKIWSDTTQFTADTIIISMANNAVKQLNLINQGFVISESKEKLYDQVKGKKIVVNLEDDAIQDMIVNGNAESIFYIRDDDGSYLGVNKTECSSIKFIFSERQLENIRFLSNPSSRLLPMEQTDHSQLRLSGFLWSQTDKPQSINQIIRIGNEEF